MEQTSRKNKSVFNNRSLFQVREFHKAYCVNIVDILTSGKVDIGSNSLTCQVFVVLFCE